MAERGPRHSAIWTKQLVDQLRSQGVAVEPLLGRAGITAADLGDGDGFLPFTKVAAFFEFATQATGDDLLALRFGQNREVRDAGLIAYIGLSAPRLGDSWRNLSRYIRVFGEATELDLSEFESDGRLRWLYHIPLNQERKCYTEFAGTILLHTARLLTKTDVRPLSVSFAHPRRRNLDAFADFFGVPVKFDARENVIRFAQQDIDRPLLTADDRLAGILRAHCEDVLARRGSQRPGLVEQVERSIIRQFGGAGSLVVRVASDLGMSQRTLARRLAESGTSFTKVVEALKQALAERYLLHSDMSLSEIAFLLGYSDLSAFTTAFKRWTGETPGAVRRASLA